MNLRALLVVLCITPATALAAPPAKPAKVRSVEGITEYRLANGLQVLLFPDATQSTFTVNITYLVGSRHEGYGETGMAHLLEHMMFKGSPRHRNVLKILNERGGQANGSTWLDRTNYYETLPASQDNLDWTLDLEADRMRNASISPDDLKTEFSVVRNEFEMGENNPEGILGERVISTAFLWHNYGKDTIGSRTDIERVPVPALKAFYDRYYQPDNAVLIVAGKFDDAKALASIDRLFGTIAKPSRTLSATYTVEPVQDGERQVTLRRNGDVSIVATAYHTVAGTSDDFPAVEAALDVLAREPSGRLYKALVETKLAASVSSYAMPAHDPYVAKFTVEVRDAKNVPRVEDILEKQVEGLGATKIDPKAVERWRTTTLKELELAFTDSREIAVALSEYAALGDWRTIFAYRDRVAKVTVDDVTRVAKTFFKSSNRTLGRFLPTKSPDRAPLVETPDVQQYVKGIESSTAKDQGEAFAATLDNIEAHTTRKELAGGISAALLPKKTRGGKVELVLRLHWGDETSLKNKQAAADLLGAMLARGTAKKSYQDLQDAEDALKAHISINTDVDGLSLRIETLRDKLAPSIELAFEMLQQPSFPAKQFELVRQEQLANLEQQLQDPETISFSTLEQMTNPWPKSDPRHVRSVPEEIADTKAASLAQVKAFYKDFVGAGHGELAVIGDFDAPAITTQVEKLTAKWQSKKPYTRLTQKVWSVPGAQKSVDIKDKEMTSIGLGQDFAMKDTDPDYAAMLMAAQIVGGDTGSRTWMRLREAEGLSYGVGTWASADTFDGVGNFGGYAIVAPQNLAKAKASLIDELTKITTARASDAELRRAKDSWIKDEDTSLSSDSRVAQMLVQQAFRKRTMQYSKDLRAKIQAVTPADIERVAKKYLDVKRFVIVDAGDASKAATK